MNNQNNPYSLQASREDVTEPLGAFEDANNIALQRYLRKWNWGAFFFGHWWLIANRKYVLLLSYFIPILNIAIAFKCLFSQC